MIILQKNAHYLCHSERRTCYVQYHVFVKRSNRLELIQYDKIAVRISWLFFAETLELLRLNGFLIPSYFRKKYMKLACCDLHSIVSHCSQMHYNSHVSSYYCSLLGESSFTAVKGKAMPLQACIVSVIQ
jgi:hypothetical protein